MSTAQHILASNICPKTLEKDGMDYFKKNLSLAKDVSVYLDAIKLFIIQDVMRININEVFNCEIPRPQIEASEEQSLPISSVLLNETSQNRYSNIRKTVFDTRQCSKENVTPIYQVTNKRPKF